MKTVKSFIIAIAALAAFASCNKAEFISPAFVTFNNARVNIKEDVEIYEIPLSLFGADQCVVTYKVVPGTAKLTENFTVVDKAGKPVKTQILTLTSDPETSESIYIKPVYNHEYIGNLKFEIQLVAAATDGVALGATRSAAVTLIDCEGGLGLILGDWISVEGSVDSDGESVDTYLTIEEVDPEEDEVAAEVYPEANLAITESTWTFANGNKFGVDIAPIYGEYDLNIAKIKFYGLQPFVELNFGGSFGVLPVAWSPQATSLAQLASKEPFYVRASETELVYEGICVCWLLHPDGSPYDGYAAGDLADEYTLVRP